MEATTEATQSGSADSGSIDQSSYMNDAFSSYFDEATDSNEPEVEPKAQEPKQAAQPQAEEPKQPEAIETKPEGETGDKPDPFDTAFSTDAGDFDVEKWMGLNFDGSDFQKIDPKPQAQPMEQRVPQWQKELDEEKQFRESIETSRLGPLERAHELLMSGMDAEQALKQAYDEARQDNEGFFKQRETEMSFKRRQEELDKIRDETRNANMPELAKSNAFSIINRLPGEKSEAKIELYNRIMFGPDAGGEILTDMFEARFPDYAKESPEKQDALKLKFVNELQADGPRLQRHFERARRILAARPENMKKIMEQVARTKEQQVRSNALAAQKAPSGTVQRPAPNRTPSPWDSYLGGGESRTRI
jgi:hypothetical protein